MVLAQQRRDVLNRRILFFVVATIAYNVIEAIVALTEGSRVSSTALIGFGLDSCRVRLDDRRVRRAF